MGTILFLENVVTGLWTRLTDVPAPPSTGEMVISDPRVGAASTRFYRLVTPRQ